MKKKNFPQLMNELIADSRFRTICLNQGPVNYLPHTESIPPSNRKTPFSTATPASITNFLTWFCQPQGTHGLGDIFIKEIALNVLNRVHHFAPENYGKIAKENFFTNFNTVKLTNTDFSNAYVYCDRSVDRPEGDIIITDDESKTLIVLNYRYDSKMTPKTYKLVSDNQYKYFENKVFVSFDHLVQTEKNSPWVYLSNNCITSLCENLIENRTTIHPTAKVYIKDFYRAVTGRPYTANMNKGDIAISTLVSDYFSVLKDLRVYKAEKISDRPLIEVTPIEFRSDYLNKVSEYEQEVLGLYWRYQNTFNTLLTALPLVEISNDFLATQKNNAYRIERKYLGPVARLTPKFDHIKSEHSYLNNIFDLEMVRNIEGTHFVSLVINKKFWDYLPEGHRIAIQKRMNFDGTILEDRAEIWSKQYEPNWKNTSLLKDMLGYFDTIYTYIDELSIKAA